jgi:hypothetical protein
MKRGVYIWDCIAKCEKGYIRAWAAPSVLPCSRQSMTCYMMRHSFKYVELQLNITPTTANFGVISVLFINTVQISCILHSDDKPVDTWRPFPEIMCSAVQLVFLIVI